MLHAEMIIAYIFVRKPERKGQLERPKHKREDNVNKNLQEREWE
jgi:hypothetical protein